jgi:serine/threonine protein kinase
MNARALDRHAEIPAHGDVVGSKYRLEATLGRGGMGIVFAARHTISQRRVALKWLDPELHASPEARERFLREAEAMGRIEHPHVVTVLDVGTTDRGSFLVMELLRGESLRTFLERAKRLPAREAIELLLPVVSGVEAAHRAGVVHRDLKPDNLFVTRAETSDRPSLHILDFGVAKLYGRPSLPPVSRKTPLPTQTGQLMGTPRYMAPEQVSGAKTDERTDVWGLGSIAYEMLTGRAPFDCEGEARLFVSIATETPKSVTDLVPDVQPDLAAVVARALSKSRDERHPSAASFGRALGDCVGLPFREPRRASSQRLPEVEARDVLASTAPGRRSPADDEPPTSAIVTRPDYANVAPSEPPPPLCSTEIDPHEMQTRRPTRLPRALAGSRPRLTLVALCAALVLLLLLASVVAARS